jgi:hypothetical protein
MPVGLRGLTTFGLFACSEWVAMRKRRLPPEPIGFTTLPIANSQKRCFKLSMRVLRLCHDGETRAD